jgi:hypothetical protein
MLQAARITVVSFALVAISVTAQAAQNNGGGPSKQDILAACEATHNACLDACNRSITPGPGADFLHTSCENDCNDAALACEKSAAVHSHAVIRTLPDRYQHLVCVYAQGSAIHQCELSQSGPQSKAGMPCYCGNSPKGIIKSVPLTVAP